MFDGSETDGAAPWANGSPMLRRPPRFGPLARRPAPTPPAPIVSPVLNLPVVPAAGTPPHPALADHDRQLRGFAELDWEALRRRNPAAAEAAAQHAARIAAARNALAARVNARPAPPGGPSASGGAALRRSRLQGAQDALREQIPGWGDDLATRLKTYAASLGFAPGELKAIDDPRVVKALFHAWKGSGDGGDAGTGQGAPRSDPDSVGEPAETGGPHGSRRGLAGSPATHQLPLARVGQRSSALEPGLSDRSSIEDWMKIRNAQVRRRRNPINPQ